MLQKSVHKHSYRLFDDLQLSSNEFYELLEATIAKYQYPKVQTSRADLQTSGWLLDRREYLKISRGEFHFYVCASPFGRSFFISWWLREEEDWLRKQLMKVGIVRFLFTNRILTFFQRDTRLMFAGAIDGLIAEAADSVNPQHIKRKPAPALVDQQVP